MKRQILILTLIVFFLSSWMIQAETTKSVADWVADLSSRDRQVSYNASEKLVDLCLQNPTQVIPQLIALFPKQIPNTRERILFIFRDVCRYNQMEDKTVDPQLINFFLQTLRQDESPVLRATAARIISMIRFKTSTEKVVSVLLQALTKDSDLQVRIEVAAALWRICKHPAVLAKLNPMLRESDFYSYYDVCDLITEIGPPAKDTVPNLIKNLEDDSAGERTRYILRALGSIGPAAKAAVPVLTSLLAGENKDLIILVAKSIFLINGSQEALQVLLEALSDESETIRMQAADSIGDLEPNIQTDLPKVIQTLLPALSDPNEDISDAIYRTLWNLIKKSFAQTDSIDSTTIPALVKLLRDGSPKLRRDALDLLCSIGEVVKKHLDSSFMPLMLQALQDDDLYIRRVAIQLLRRLGPMSRQALPLLKEIMTGPDEELHQEAQSAIFYITHFIEAAEKTSIEVNGLTVTLRRLLDQRSTGDPSELSLSFDISGDIIKDVCRYKLSILQVQDDTERDLLKDSKFSGTYEKPIGQNLTQLDFQIRLKNPARRATMIQELSGEVNLYIPKNDPKATVIIPDFLAQAEKPFDHPGLKVAGIELTLFTKSRYESYQQLKQQAEDEQNKDSIVPTIINLFKFWLGGIKIGPNTIILNIDDPQEKIIALEFVDETGQIIQSFGQAWDEDFSIFDFEHPLPPKAKLVVYLSSPKSFINFPFTFKNVPLP